MLFRSTRSDLIVSILEKQPPALIDDTYGHPPALSRIFDKAFKKNTDERYQTARELLDDLNNLPYIEAVIKEASRLFPPGPINHRVSSHEDDIGGYTWKVI